MLSGVSFALSPLPFSAAVWSGNGAALREPSWILLVASLSALTSLLAGWVLPRSPELGERLSFGAFAGISALLFEELVASPALTLIWALLATAAVFALVRAPRDPTPPFASEPRRAIRARAAASTVALWMIGTFLFSARGDSVEQWTLVFALLIAASLAARWLDREGVNHLWRSTLMLGSWIAAVALIALNWGLWWRCLAIASVVPIAAIILLPSLSAAKGVTAWWDPIAGHPERLLVATFFALCLLGTTMLALPAASSEAESIGFVDAMFTAVSAVCVTGLTVLDTNTDFSVPGQVMILLLIQVGGLGIMTFSTAAMGLLGGRLSLKHEGAMADLISPQDRGQLFRATQRILAYTFACETGGAILLTPAFYAHGHEFPSALWRGVFTSISAFCNAGFGLDSTNLVPYAEDPYLLGVVSALIIAGGTSPLAVLSIPALFKSAKPISAHAKLVLVATAVLLITGFLGMLAFEWRGVLAKMSIVDRLSNAWLLSVAARTAGFNAVDLTALDPSSLSLMMLLMFIGASPGSTGGGIKVTTIAVLVLAVLSVIRGSTQVEAFGKRVSTRTVYRAAAIITAGAAGVFAALLALQLTQSMQTQLAFFEVVSALATVGLTIGGTAQLDAVGKTIIAACMFIGRIGTLSFFMFLTHRATHRVVWDRPEEDVAVG